MQTWVLLLRYMAELLTRRRTRWIEVSVSRAWSHDMQPRLFDLGD